MFDFAFHTENNELREISVPAQERGLVSHVDMPLHAIELTPHAKLMLKAHYIREQYNTHLETPRLDLSC